MYYNILKKDLKRKKTMNLILLLFITMASTFISSSVNNTVSILNATDNYFEQAGVGDYFVMTLWEEKNEKKVQEFFEQNPYIKQWSRDEVLITYQDYFEKEDGKTLSMQNMGMLSTFDIRQQKFFDSENQEITDMKDNEIYLPLKTMQDNELEKGDSIYFCKDGKQMKFTVGGNHKDALLSSPLMGVARILVSTDTYEAIKEQNDMQKGMIYSAKTDQIKKLEDDFNQTGIQTIFSGNRDLVKFTYVMDLVIAGILLIVSICLILISMVILRFTIVFTLNEEFREIGIMHAIGVRHSKIRGIYIVKYLMISMTGALAGFVIGLPLGEAFLQQVSRNMVITSMENSWHMNLLCSLAVVVIVILFCYTCTARVKKFSPVDAIRNGSTGERFSKKGVLKLEKWHGSAVSFLSVNDICTGLRSFGVLILIFTLGMLLIMVPVNTINTLNSEHLVTWFGMTEADAYLVNEAKSDTLVKEEGRAGIEQSLKEVEKNLADHGIKAKACQETMFKFQVSLQEKGYNVFCIQGTGTTAGQYNYEEGTAPEYEDEVAITKMAADHIDAKIGDTVTINVGNQEKDFLITAYYQSMNNMGEGLRFSEKTELDYSIAFGSFAIQIAYQDEPSQKEKEERAELLKELYPEYEYYTGGEYLNNMMGNITEPMVAVKQLIVAVIMLINMMVVILVSKTFIAKERGEIGMLKAIGFHNRALIQWQVLRIGIILVLSVILGALLANPAAQISSGKIFEIMGATRIEFVVKPLEVYVFYPLLMLAATILGAILAAGQIRRISAQETNNIE